MSQQSRDFEIVLIWPSLQILEFAIPPFCFQSELRREPWEKWNNRNSSRFWVLTYFNPNWKSLFIRISLSVCLSVSTESGGTWEDDIGCPERSMDVPLRSTCLLIFHLLSLLHRALGAWATGNSTPAFLHSPLHFQCCYRMWAVMQHPPPPKSLPARRLSEIMAVSRFPLHAALATCRRARGDWSNISCILRSASQVEKDSPKGSCVAILHRPWFGALHVWGRILWTFSSSALLLVLFWITFLKTKS